MGSHLSFAHIAQVILCAGSNTGSADRSGFADIHSEAGAFSIAEMGTIMAAHADLFGFSYKDHDEDRYRVCGATRSNLAASP